MNQHRKQVHRVANGKRPERVVARVARRISSRPGYEQVASVRLVTSTYRLADWFEGQPVPVAEHVHAVCAVERTDPT